MINSVDEIREYRNHLVDVVYSKTRTQQQIDQTYIDDTFDVPEIKEPTQIYRSGYGVRIVDAPADQIVTADPQVFVETVSRNKASAENIAKYFNKEFIEILKRGNPNIWKEFNKGQLGRGIAYFKIIHNESWVNKKMLKKGLPIYFIVLDPMVVYASPEEDDNGIPDKVVIQYERQIKDLLIRYPDWSNPKVNEKTKEKQTATWMEYWDKDITYFEADGESVRIENNGIYPNPYGITPFVRKFSGFGRRSPDGEMASLIVSDIRYSRDLIREECVMRSNIDSQYFLFAHPDLFITSPGELPKVEDLNQQMKFGGYHINAIGNIPEGTVWDWRKIEPSAAMSAHHQSIIAQLNQKHPFIMAGFPQGTSGRQQDMTETSASRKYDSTIENCEVAFATALEIARTIIKEVLGLAKETGLSKDDLKVPIQIQVRLKADDAVAQGRASAEGSRLYQLGEIDLLEDLVKHKGYTVDGAKDIMNRRIVEDVVTRDPTIRELIAIRTAREMGMEEDYIKIVEQRKQVEKGLSTVPETGSEGGEPRIGNISTEIGAEQVDVSTTQRPRRLSPAPAEVV